MKKGRKLPAYGIVAHVMLTITIVLSLQVDKNSQVFSSPPAGELEVLRRRPPPYHCHPVDGLRTSSTDTADRRPDSGCQCSVRALGLMLSDLVVSPSRTRPRGPGSLAAPCRSTGPSESCGMGRGPDLILTLHAGLRQGGRRRRRGDAGACCAAAAATVPQTEPEW